MSSLDNDSSRQVFEDTPYQNFDAVAKRIESGLSEQSRSELVKAHENLVVEFEKAISGIIIAGSTVDSARYNELIQKLKSQNQTLKVKAPNSSIIQKIQNVLKNDFFKKIDQKLQHLGNIANRLAERAHVKEDLLKKQFNALKTDVDASQLQKILSDQFDGVKVEVDTGKNYDRLWTLVTQNVSPAKIRQNEDAAFLVTFVGLHRTFLKVNDEQYEGLRKFLSGEASFTQTPELRKALLEHIDAARSELKGNVHVDNNEPHNLFEILPIKTQETVIQKLAEASNARLTPLKKGIKALADELRLNPQELNEIYRNSLPENEKAKALGKPLGSFNFADLTQLRGLLIKHRDAAIIREVSAKKSISTLGQGARELLSFYIQLENQLSSGSDNLPVEDKINIKKSALKTIEKFIPPYAQEEILSLGVTLTEIAGTKDHFNPPAHVLHELPLNALIKTTRLLLEHQKKIADQDVKSQRKLENEFGLLPKKEQEHRLENLKTVVDVIKLIDARSVNNFEYTALSAKLKEVLVHEDPATQKALIEYGQHLASVKHSFLSKVEVQSKEGYLGSGVIKQTIIQTLPSDKLYSYLQTIFEDSNLPSIPFEASRSLDRLEDSLKYEKVELKDLLNFVNEEELVESLSAGELLQVNQAINDQIAIRKGKAIEAKIQESQVKKAVNTTNIEEIKENQVITVGLPSELPRIELNIPEKVFEGSESAFTTDNDLKHELPQKLSTNEITARSISNYSKQPGTVKFEGEPIADCYFAEVAPNAKLLGIADGCGWGDKSKQAAHTAAKTVTDYIKAQLSSGEIKDTQALGQVLLNAVNEAHQAIVKSSDSPGTTTLTFSVQVPIPPKEGDSGTKWVGVLVGIGDSKAYVKRAQTDKIQELTRGSRGNISDPKDPGGRIGPYIGTPSLVDPDTRNLQLRLFTLEEGDEIIIESDGVHDNFDLEENGLPPLISEEILLFQNPNDRLSLNDFLQKYSISQSDCESLLINLSSILDLGSKERIAKNIELQLKSLGKSIDSKTLRSDVNKVLNQRFYEQDQKQLNAAKEQYARENNIPFDNQSESLERSVLEKNKEIIKQRYDIPPDIVTGFKAKLKEFKENSGLVAEPLICNSWDPKEIIQSWDKEEKLSKIQKYKLEQQLTNALQDLKADYAEWKKEQVLNSEDSLGENTTEKWVNFAKQTAEPIKNLLFQNLSAKNSDSTNFPGKPDHATAISITIKNPH